MSVVFVRKLDDDPDRGKYLRPKWGSIVDTFSCELPFHWPKGDVLEDCRAVVFSKERFKHGGPG